MMAESRTGAPTGDSALPASGSNAALERVKLALGWLVVLAPAAWGVSQVVMKSAALFTR